MLQKQINLLKIYIGILLMYVVISSGIAAYYITNLYDEVWYVQYNIERVEENHIESISQVKEHLETISDFIYGIRN